MNANVGFYGKLPIIGDFVSRRLPNDFIKPWDNWLQSAIATSKEQLGGQWLNSYLTSPIWRFLLSAGVCGDKAVAGIMMPSVDRAGRYFPMTVAVLFEQSSTLPLLFTTSNVWFEQLEDIALSGLNDNLDINTFDQLLQSIPNYTATDTGKNYVYSRLDKSGQLSDFSGEELLASFTFGRSLWTSDNEEQTPPAIIACSGLPPIGSFAIFLKNQFNTAIPTKAPPELPSLSSILASGNESYGRCSWAITHTGKRRKHNEDSILNKPEANLWVVADGMGGHKAGDVASQLIVNTLNNLSGIAPLEDYLASVAQSLQNVNKQLRQLAVSEYDNHLIGSTMVALVCDSERGAVLWAGDSRLYRFRENQLQQLTEDHCAEQEKIASAGTLKKANIITRAVGAEECLELDIKMLDLMENDIFLLSSDGLDKEMSVNEIEHIMQTEAPENLANSLINEVLARGARDNVSVIVIGKYTRGTANGY
jgi:type VI secretion system protein ImpM